MTTSFKSMAAALSAAFLATLAFGSAGYDVHLQKRDYVRTGQEARLVGTVRLVGTRPEPLGIDMSGDPKCYDLNPDPTTEWYEGESDGLANVLVYVASNTLDSYSFETPSVSVVLDQKGCRYVPHVLGMQVGQTLSIQNNDSTMSNVHPTPKYNSEWNLTQPAGSPPLLKVFRHAEVAIPFKDNQHPWKKAYVGVFAHPFFAVTDSQGNYRIEGLPPASYKVNAWHERLGEKTFDLVVAPGESRYLSFDFSRGELKK